MRRFTRGLLSSAPLLMRRGKIVTWIGLTAAIGTGVGLLLRAQTVVATKRTNAAVSNVGTQPPKLALKFASDELKPKKVRERSEENNAARVNRTALRSIVPAVLPSPPLPSRVLPGPIPSSNHAASGDQSRLLPTPPIPSKIPPVPVPESAENEPAAAHETR
jgi:hypothetical protein